MEVLRRFRRSWRFPTALLCIYGFFSTVKPLEPFLVPFLTGPDKNLTEEQVNGQVFPVWTYSYLAVLVPVFLLTDWLRYKPVVVLQCSALFVTTAFLRWLDTVPAMQTMQFFYAVVTACEVAYFSYIYSMVEPKRYRRVTSYCRSVQLLGYTVGAVLGQILVSLELLSFNGITEFTLVLTSIALLTSIFLPMPQRSMFFHRKTAEEPEKDGDGRGEGGEDGNKGGGGGEEKKVEESAEGQSCGRVLLQLLRDFRQCYSSRQLLYWSLWWAMATCGYNQTVNYVQFLWGHIQEQTEPSGNFSIYNGAVEAASNLMGAATAYGVGFIEVRWEQWGELALGVFSALGSGALFLMTFSYNIWLSYVSYVLFKCLYMLLITIAMYQIAVDLSMERYALVFGANTFAALVLQTIITSVVVDTTALGLPIVPQFIIYSSYFSVIAVVFLVRGIFTLWKARRRQIRPKDSAQLPENAPSMFEEQKF